MKDPINWTRVKNDINGNPRYVCHFFCLLPEKEIRNYGMTIEIKYNRAIKRANLLGGKKYRGNDFGGGIVFQSYNILDTERRINEFLSANE